MRRLDGCLPALLVVGTMVSCSDMSESIVDESAGLNGGFEITQSGLPGNWLVYTPSTIPSGDYDLVVDTMEYRSGKQSLKFVVRECSPDGGWRSPGLSRQVDATPGAAYKVGFWAKNEGTEFRFRVGGVSAKEGQYEIVVQSDETTAHWRRYEHEYHMPEGLGQLRLEMNVLRPGALWIDDVTIETLSASGNPDGD